MTETSHEHEHKKQPVLLVRILKNPWFYVTLLCVAIIAGGGLFLFMRITNSRVYTDTASISAPEISLAPTTAGTLQQIYVQDGDFVKANTPVARVGNELIKTTVDSIVVSENNNIGALFNPGQPVVTVIEPSQLRVDAQVEEDKGLNRIKVGDRVIFTVDAFGAKQYVGVVSSISPTATASDVVFNISNTRQEQNFDVKIRFDTSAYPELKNGMSARAWIYQ